MRNIVISIAKRLFHLYSSPHWQVEAVAYDNPIPGYGTRNTINLRLWAAKPDGQYDMVTLSIHSSMSLI